MKKLLFGALTFALITTSCIKDDLADLDKKIDDLNAKITALAEKVAGVATLQTGLTAAQAQLTALSAAVAALPGTAATAALSASLATITANVNSISTALGTLATDIVAGTMSTQALVTQLIATTAANQTATLARVATAQTALNDAITAFNASLNTTLLAQNAAATANQAETTALVNSLQAALIVAINSGNTALIADLTAQLAAATAANAEAIAETNDLLTELIADLVIKLHDSEVVTDGLISNLALQLTAATAANDAAITAAQNALTLDNASQTTALKLLIDAMSAQLTAAQAEITLILANQVSPLTAVTIDNTTPQVGSLLTALPVTALGATTLATYQWYQGSTAIAGATAKTYTVLLADLGLTIKVKATGTGNALSAELSSASTSAVTAATPLLSVTIQGVAQVGNLLRVNVITPTTTSVSYQWQVCTTSGGTYTDIAGATTSKYYPTTDDATKFIKLSITGTGSLTGTVVSGATSAVIYPEPLTAIAVITGGTTAQVNTVLTVGATTPVTAFSSANLALGFRTSATYQWQICSTVGGTYTDIAGATASTYTPAVADLGKFIHVVATGRYWTYGSQTSVPTAAVIYPTSFTGIGAITGTVTVGSTLTAGALTPTDATVDYQWQNSNSVGGTYSDIPGATSSTYVVQSSDYNKSIHVVATANGGYFGTRTSADLALVPGYAIVSPSFSMATANNLITITLTGGTFKTGPLVIGDFTFTGADAITTGIVTKVSSSVATVTAAAGTYAALGYTNSNIVSVPTATMATQASSVAVVPSTQVIFSTVVTPTIATAVGNTTLTLTLTDGTFRAGNVFNTDFGIAGTDAARFTIGNGATYTRTSATVVTITTLTAITAVNDLAFTVRPYAQATQATAVAGVVTPIVTVITGAITPTIGDTKLVVTLTGGSFKGTLATDLAAGDFTFTGFSVADNAAILAGAFVRTSATVCTITPSPAFAAITTGTVLVKTTTMTVQATSVAGATAL